ncbi:hypothetical protein ABVK25_004263 [Lepraria finkii]|uniref:Secreted protein n=1 Tax=Lepraria finkii TaxID=1340010 RepID=A0ABR4BCS1_9LECA
MFFCAILLAVTATPTQSNSSLPIVDLGCVLQCVMTFNVSVPCSELTETFLLAAFSICSNWRLQFLKYPLRSASHWGVTLPRTSKSQDRSNHPKWRKTVISVINQLRIGSHQAQA